MSRHWSPDDEIARIEPLRERRTWPAGATAGLLLVAAACFGAVMVVYQIAGPHDVFEADAGPE
jgi:hypothetical protein